jgi:hypothetical protein
MNAWIERMRNSVNLGTRIMKNGALDGKYGLWKISKAKQYFQEVLWVFVEFLSDWKLWHERTGALAKFGIFLRILVDFWSGLGPVCKYFSETEGPTIILPSVQGSHRNLQQG